MDNISDSDSGPKGEGRAGEGREVIGRQNGNLEFPILFSSSRSKKCLILLLFADVGGKVVKGVVVHHPG